MEAIQQSTKDNDYAVAKTLNEQVAGLIIVVLIAEVSGLPQDFGVKDINRAYVLLANELERLYSRNRELSEIKPTPVWRRFDVIEASTWDIHDYFTNFNDNVLHAHIARVNRLCIISGKETPDFSPAQARLVEYADKVRREYGAILEEVKAKNKAQYEKDWYIPEYTLAYDQIMGIIKVNGVYQLNKYSTHDGYNVDLLLKQSLAQPNDLFSPELNQTKKNISTILSNAGFTPVLKKLFFPIAREDRGVLCRPIVTRAEADAEAIDTSELDLKLKEMGADARSGKSS